MFCDQCGAAVEPGAKFCEECGAQVDKVSSGLSLPKRKTFLLAALSLAAVLGISILLLFVKGPSSIIEPESSVTEESRETKAGAGKSPRVGVSKSLEAARRELGQLGIQYSEGAFIESVKNNDTLAVGLFLAAGMSPNATERGETALMIAAAEGHTAIVKALIAKDADVNARDQFSGRTALMRAAQGGHTDVVKVLLAKGANVNAQNGRTALMLAVENRHTDIVQALLDKGANVNAQTGDSVTALMIAAEKGDTDVVKTLVGKGAAVNAKAGNGATPLMLAAANGHTAVVQALLDKGADVNAQAMGRLSRSNFLTSRQGRSGKGTHTPIPLL